MPPRETRRDQILMYIAVFVTDNHNAPSTLEIAEQFSISKQTAYEHLKTLLIEGRLIRTIHGRWKIPDAEYIAPPDLR